MGISVSVSIRVSISVSVSVRISVSVSVSVSVSMGVLWISPSRIYRQERRFRKETFSKGDVFARLGEPGVRRRRRA